MGNPTTALQAREIADGIMDLIECEGADHWCVKGTECFCRDRIAAVLTTYGDARYREGLAEIERLQAALRITKRDVFETIDHIIALSPQEAKRIGRNALNRIDTSISGKGET